MNRRRPGQNSLRPAKKKNCSTERHGGPPHSVAVQGHEAEATLATIRKYMESLIERKLRMFAADRMQIIGARIVMGEDGNRIEVASGNLL